MVCRLCVLLVLLVLSAANDRELENDIDIIHCVFMQNAMVVVLINYAIHETYFFKIGTSIHYDMHLITVRYIIVFYQHWKIVFFISKFV